MTLRHMQIFVAVAECKNMSQAARRLYIAQPTVSQAIGEIEAFYGCRLFERLNKKLYITEAGERLLPYAQNLVSLSDEMHRVMDLGSRRKIIKVGATITVGTCVLAETVNRVEAAHPDMGIEVLVDNTAQIESRLLDGRLDLALVEGQVKSADLLVKPVIRDELVLVCGPAHPFAALQSVAPEALAGEAFVLRESGSGTRESFDRFAEERRLSVYVKWVCHSSDAILSAVESGQGLSVISRRLVALSGKADRLHIVPMEGAALFRWFSLVYHKNKFLSEPLCHFIDAVCAAE